jgi:hypothetical protein
MAARIAQLDVEVRESRAGWIVDWAELGEVDQ